MQELTFPDRYPVGDLYEQPAGKVRWKKIGPAVGEFTVHPETEYRLKLRGSFLGRTDALRILSTLPVDLLDEIELRMPVSSTDLMDASTSGTGWLKATLRAEEARLQADLDCTARIVVRARVR